MAKPAFSEVKPEDDLTTVEELDTSRIHFCPRCGEPGFLTSRECWNSQATNPVHYSYYFFGHSSNGRRTWCYLGKNLDKYLTGKREENGNNAADQ
jgi:hypothetical protein